MKSGLVYTFGTNGFLAAITHPCGQGLTFAYGVPAGDTRSRLLSVTHSNGKYLQFQYAAGRLARVNTPDPAVYVVYVQDADGDLVAVVRHGAQGVWTTTYTYQIGVPDGVNTPYTPEYIAQMRSQDWQSNHWLVERVNGAGERFTYTYRSDPDAVAVALSVRGPQDEYATRLEYEDNNLTRVNALRDGKTLSTDYYYDPLTLLMQQVVGPTDTTRIESYRYDPRFCPIEHRYSEDGDYLSLAATYDSGRNPISLGAGYNQTPVQDWHLGWNSADKTLASVTDPLGRTVTVSYTNSLPADVAVNGNSGQVYRTSFAYLPGGLLAAVTNANGNAVQLGYDGQGYATNILVGTDIWVSIQYNALGYATNITMPGENGVRSVSLSVDEGGRPLSVIYPNGQSESFLYDGLGHLTNAVDVAGRAWNGTYHGGEMVKAERFFGPATSDVERIEVAYDEQMNMRVVKDPLGREVERYILDDADRVVAVTNIQGQAMQVSYGVSKLIKSIRRFDGTAVTFGYDGKGALTNLTYPDSRLDYGRLVNGLPAFAANEEGVVSNTFDAANRLTHVEQCVSGGGVDYAYYPAGNVASVSNVAGVTTYTNDTAERVTTIGSPVGQFGLAYNHWNGLAETVAYPNGMSANYHYDVMDRVTNVEYRDAGGTVVRATAMGYDAAGMIATNRITAGGRKAIRVNP